MMEDAQELALEMVGRDKKSFEKDAVIVQLEKEMELAARNLQFEKAAEIRDVLSTIQAN